MPKYLFNVMLVDKFSQGNVLIFRFEEFSNRGFKLQHTFNQAPSILLQALTVIDNREIANAATRSS